MGLLHTFYGMADGFLGDWLGEGTDYRFLSKASAYERKAYVNRLYGTPYGCWLWDPDWKSLVEREPGVKLALFGRPSSERGSEPAKDGVSVPYKGPYRLLRAADLPEAIAILKRLQKGQKRRLSESTGLWVGRLEQFFRTMAQEANGVLIPPPRRRPRSPFLFPHH